MNYARKSPDESLSYGDERVFLIRFGIGWSDDGKKDINKHWKKNKVLLKRLPCIRRDDLSVVIIRIVSTWHMNGTEWKWDFSKCFFKSWVSIRFNIVILNFKEKKKSKRPIFILCHSYILWKLFWIHSSQCSRWIVLNLDPLSIVNAIECYRAIPYINSVPSVSKYVS